MVVLRWLYCDSSSLCWAPIFYPHSALCMSGFIWAFRENWNVNENQFVLTWMALRRLMQINNQLCSHLLDSAAGNVSVLICWILLNVSSNAMPFNLNPDFYHWAYALPTYEAYSSFSRTFCRVIVFWSGSDLFPFSLPGLRGTSMMSYRSVSWMLARYYLLKPKQNWASLLFNGVLSLPETILPMGN